jgi:hypothetical protein
MVNEDNIYDLTKRNMHYNISIENVIRSTVDGNETASQLARNVPYGLTDYIVTLIKDNDASDWSAPTASGIVYAWYNTINDVMPYKMGGPS